MIIHVLDQGRRTGYAHGPAGMKPRPGFLILRESKECPSIGFGSLIHYLDKLWRIERPDLFVFEEPQGVAQWHASNKSKPFPTSPDGVESGLMLTAIMMGVANRWGIPFKEVRRQSLTKHLFNDGRMNREAGKLACINHCISLGYVDEFCKDEDMCDAICMHIYASDVFARTPQKEFKLIG